VSERNGFDGFEIGHGVICADHPKRSSGRQDQAINRRD
jgi:hypothetical protein